MIVIENGIASGRADPCPRLPGVHEARAVLPGQHEACAVLPGQHAQDT